MISSLRSESLLGAFSQRSLTHSQSALTASVSRLSTGIEVHRASDGASNLAISESIRKQLSSLNSSVANLDAATAALQTIDASLADVESVLQKIKELSTQGANASITSSQRRAITGEISELFNVIGDISNRTQYNGIPLLDGTHGTYTHAQFLAPNQLSGDVTSSLRSTTFRIFDSSETGATPDTSSIVWLAGVSSDLNASGSYTLTADGADVVLTKLGSDSNPNSSQRLTLVSGSPSDSSQVQISSGTSDTMELNFGEMGVTLRVGTSRKGSNHLPSELATLIGGIGMLPDPSIRNSWTRVDASWDHPFSAENYPDGVKVIVSSANGNIKLDSDVLASILNQEDYLLSSVKDYNGAGDSGDDVTEAWTDGSANVIAFTGSQAEAQSLLESLSLNTPNGMDSLTVTVVPSNISVNVNEDGSTSYYEIGEEPGGLVWSAAKGLAQDSEFAGLTGYLANVTSEQESNFLRQKLGENGWIGASDYLDDVNAAITARNAATGETRELYANQAAVEGHWFWTDGPEIGLEFYDENTMQNVSGGAGQVAESWSDWAGGEPNNWGGDEGYAYLIGGSSWNDYRSTNDGVTRYVIEYGGKLGEVANTTKTLSIGLPTRLDIGKPISVSDVSLSGGRDGQYKLSANPSDSTVTISRFDNRYGRLIASQTMSTDITIDEGEVRRFTFDEMGVSLTIANLWDKQVSLGSKDSGLDSEGLLIAQNVSETAVDDDGFIFQSGALSRHANKIFPALDVSQNSSESPISGLTSAINQLLQDEEFSFESMTAVADQVDFALDALIRMHSTVGTSINTTLNTREALSRQSEGLQAALGNLIDTDYARETAQLTRLQIGQQVSAAMLAQVNLIPSVVQALLP